MASPPVSPRAAAADDDQDAGQVAAGPEALEQPLEDEPFADEPVQRGECGDPEGAGHGDDGAAGSRWMSPPRRSMSLVPVAWPGEDGPGG